jgi:hypothetical protein
MTTSTWKVQMQSITSDNKNIDNTIAVSMNDNIYMDWTVQ